MSLLHFQNTCHTIMTTYEPEQWGLQARKFLSTIDPDFWETVELTANDFPLWLWPIIGSHLKNFNTPVRCTEYEHWCLFLSLTTYFHDTNATPDKPRSSLFVGAVLNPIFSWVFQYIQDYPCFPEMLISWKHYPEMILLLHKACDLLQESHPDKAAIVLNYPDIYLYAERYEQIKSIHPEIVKKPWHATLQMIQPFLRMPSPMDDTMVHF